MNTDKKKLLNLAEIEGRASPHAAQVKGQLKMRAAAMNLVTDVSGLAEYCSAGVEKLDMGEDWAIRREIYPGVEIHLAYFRADGEFPARMQALYSGYNIKDIKGEELAMLTVSLSNQALRYIRSSNHGAQLPQICHRV